MKHPFFLFENRTGTWRVTVSARPDEVRFTVEASVTAENAPHVAPDWSAVRRIDVDDLVLPDGPEALEVARTYFITNLASSVGLEGPAEEALPRVETRTSLPDTRDPVTIVFRADGTGWVMLEIGYVTSRSGDLFNFKGRHPYHHFRHALDVPAALADTSADRDERLAALFWSDVNPTLETPLIAEGDLDGEPLSVSRGTIEEMRQTLVDLTSASAVFWRTNPDDAYGLVLRAAFDGEEADLVSEDWNTAAAKLPADYLETAGAIIRWFDPVGHVVDYNDGCSIDWSGYDRNAEKLTFEVERPTAIQALEAEERLKAWRARTGV